MPCLCGRPAVTQIYGIPLCEICAEQDKDRNLAQVEVGRMAVGDMREKVA